MCTQATARARDTRAGTAGHCCGRASAAHRTSDRASADTGDAGAAHTGSAGRAGGPGHASTCTGRAGGTRAGRALAAHRGGRHGPTAAVLAIVGAPLVRIQVDQGLIDIQIAQLVIGASPEALNTFLRDALRLVRRGIAHLRHLIPR